jgi:FixJ family two-component response regulator
VHGESSVREPLAALINAAGLCCEEFDSAEAFVSRPAPDAPHCLVMSVNLPDFASGDIQTRMATRCRRTPIIFVTDADAVPTTVRAMRPDALEFLTQPFDEAQLLYVVRKAITRSVDNRRREIARNQLDQRYQSLTPREREVMDLVVAGLQNKQVGRRLAIAEITVKVHRGRVMEKMIAASLADLVKMSIQLRFAADAAA